MIARFIARSRYAVAVLAAIKGLSRAVPFLLAGLVVLSGLDRWVELSTGGRQALWFLFVAGGAGLFVHGFMPFSMFKPASMARHLARRAASLREDDLVLALQFSRVRETDGTSAELQQEFMDRTSAKLERCSPFWCFPKWNWRGPLLIAVAAVLLTGSVRAFFPSALPLEPRTLFPFWSFEVERRVRIEPGDANVPSGKDATIRLVLLEKSTAKPVLSVKTDEHWLVLQPDSETEEGSVYIVKNVVTPLFYRVQWRGAWSRRFKLTPVEPLAVKSFQVRMTPPDYTSKPASEQTSPEITALAGTRVEMGVEVGVPLRKIALRFSDGREVGAERVDGTRATFRFMLDKSMTYGFAIDAESALSAEADYLYPINVTEDKPPTIVLLSPDQDVVVGEKEKLPVTYDAADDQGLGEVYLAYETQSARVNKVRIKSFEGAVENSLSTYDWDLAAQSFSPGQVVRFRVEAVDKNRVTGPGQAQSEWRLLEIRSFDMEHAAIQKALENWRDKALETLAGVTTLEKKVRSENADMTQAATDFNKTSQELARMEESLKQIVSKMENDPLSDYGVWLEHKSMADNLSMMNQTTVKNTQASLQTQNKQASAANLESIASELERMSALSEDLSKAQNARDVLQSGENLEELGEDLEKSLEKGGLDAETKKKLDRLLAEAQKNLAEMARALQQMPEDLPEDFINQAALKNLELGKSQDILSQIQDAIRSGDAKRALELARQFLAAAQSMRKQLSKAHESFVENNSAEELAKKIKAQQEELEKVTDEQRSVLGETQKLSSKQLEQIMREQEKLLEQLAARQARVIKDTGALSSSSKIPVVAGLSSQLAPMNVVQSEFADKHVDKSPEFLDSIVAYTKMVNAELERSSAAASAVEAVMDIQKEEAAIVDLLRHPPAPAQNVSPEDKSRFDGLEKRQQELRRKTQQVKQELQGIARKTASLGTPLMQALNRAGSEMKNAGDGLAQEDGVGAQRSEERALDSLLQGQAELEQAQNAMSEMASEQGGESGGGEGGGQKPGRGPKVIMRGGGGGKSGQTAKVKLPSAEDYKPPKAFREDLLESLKEKYPKIYEEIIHKYYKRLAE